MMLDNSLGSDSRLASAGDNRHRFNESRLPQTDPRNALRHARVVVHKGGRSVR